MATNYLHRRVFYGNWRVGKEGADPSGFLGRNMTPHTFRRLFIPSFSVGVGSNRSRHKVAPGQTCLGTVSGQRGVEKSGMIEWGEVLRMDPAGPPITSAGSIEI